MIYMFAGGFCVGVMFTLWFCGLVCCPCPEDSDSPDSPPV